MGNDAKTLPYVLAYTPPYLVSSNVSAPATPLTTPLDSAGTHAVEVPDTEAESAEVTAAFDELAKAQSSAMVGKARKMVLTLVLLAVVLALSPFVFNYVMQV